MSTSTDQYSCSPEDEDDVYIEEFRRYCEDGIDYDGFEYPCMTTPQMEV